MSLNLKYILLSGVLIQSCLAQETPFDLGLKGGVGVTQHKILDSMGFQTGNPSLGLGYIVGFFLLSQGPGFGFETNLLFAQRSSVPASQGSQDFVYTLKSLELPAIGFYRWGFVS